MNDQLLRLSDVTAMTGLGRSTIYSAIADGRFPKQIKISARSSAWSKNEIDDWIQNRLADRDRDAS